MAGKGPIELAVEVNKVSFSYNDLKALDGLSLQVPTGNKPGKGLDFNLRGSPIDIRGSPSFCLSDCTIQASVQ